MSAEKDTTSDQEMMISIPKEDHAVRVYPHPLPLSSPLPSIKAPSPGFVPEPDRTSKEFLRYGVTLYQAALKGDCSVVKYINHRSPSWIQAKITKGGETALHIAAAAKHVHFVNNLVDVMQPDSLAFTNKVGNTALCFAAVSGVVDIARAMVDKNKGLPNIRGSQDVALHILNKHRNLALLRDAKKETALHALARKPLKSVDFQLSMWKRVTMQWSGIDQERSVEPRIALRLVQNLWNEVIKLKEEDISKLIGYPWRLLFIAAKMGKVEFLTTLIRSYPDLIWKVDEKRRTIFHVAIMHRHEEIFKLIYEIGAIKDLIATYKDEQGNNMLHLAGKLAPPHRLNCVSGAALQMQREILWFKAVKNIVRPEFAEAENEDHKTPRALFSEEHEELRAKGEDWMKKTAESCTLVATLIATVVFSAAFQLPGGINGETGSPILLKRVPFVVFAMSNAVSLFTSTASVLMFLSILTSRYAEGDFLMSLPLKLVVGLTLLFVSIATMIVAFTATFFITFLEGVKWAPFPIALIASIPVTLFAFQQYPLLVDIYRATYKTHRSLFESSKSKLFEMTSPSGYAATLTSNYLSLIDQPGSSAPMTCRYNSLHRPTPSQIVDPTASEQNTPTFHSTDSP